MFDRIDTMRMAGALTAHASERQRVIARNVANADTPGFRSRDLAGFADSWRASPPTAMHASRSGHLTGTGWGSSPGLEKDTGAEPAPNGNTVSLEDEMIRSAAARREFDLSLAVTRASLSLIRTSIGRRG